MKRKKYAMTLLEIMMVIFLIGLIGSVIGYNMKGSLDEGKAFRSKHGADRIYDTLSLEMSKGATAQEVADNPKMYLKNAGILKDVDKLLKDGWGEPYAITVIRQGRDISIRSARYDAFQAKKRKDLKKVEDPVEVNEEDE